MKRRKYPFGVGRANPPAGRVNIRLDGEDMGRLEAIRDGLQRRLSGPAAGVVKLSTHDALRWAIRRTAADIEGRADG